MAILRNAIRINPDITSDKVLVQVMAEAHGVIVTHHTDNGVSYIKRWDASGMIPGIELENERGYRTRAANLDGNPVAIVGREQGDNRDGVLAYDEFLFVINGFGISGDTTYYEDVDNATYPAYYLWPDGDPQQPLTTTEPDYDWEDTLSYADRQQLAIDMIEQVWRPQKRRWLRELGEYSDVNPDITKHGGYWLRAADRALQIEFQDHTTNPLVVARLAQQASKGASDVNSVESFVTTLKPTIEAFPNGPTMPVLWVSKNEDGSVEQVDLQQSVQYTGDDKRLESNYNPIDRSWVTENQPGSFTIDDYSPYPGDVVTASNLRDPDGVIPGTIRWQWQGYQHGGWHNVQKVITGKSSNITMPDPRGNIRRYRVVVTYDDNFGPNQEIISDDVRATAPSDTL